MKNKVLLLIIILIILGVGGYLIWKFLIYKTPEQKAEEALQKTLESAAKSGAMPEITGVENPLGEGTIADINPAIPKVNPLDATNPFKGLNINPFK